MTTNWNRLRIGGLLLGGLISSVLTGCGGGREPWEKVYPVKGEIVFKGKPLKDAELSFHPLDDIVPETVRPWARTNETGEFVLSTYNQGDGAPAGRYKVTAVHHEIVVSKGGGMGVKPNNLPKKYASKETTDWIVEIADGETILPRTELK